MSFGDWFDERTGARSWMRGVLDHPIVGGARFAYAWGSALALILAVEAITGVALMTLYAPSATTAWASVAHIEFALSGGWLVRGLHHFGAHAIVVLMLIHLVQAALYGAYRKPREVNWYVGVVLFLLVLGLARTGYLLPYDQKGYWSTQVATGILGTVPGIGAFLEKLVLGGPAYGHATITHFYALHVAVLPVLVVALLVVHRALYRKQGLTPPPSADAAKVDTFHPKQLARDLALAGVVLGIVFALTLRAHGAPLEAPADVTSDFPARPDWYYVAIFEILKSVEGPLEPLVALGLILGIVLVLVGLPLVDKRPDRTRIVRAIGIAVCLLGAAALTFKSMRADAADAAFQKSRALATTRADHAIELFRKGVPPDGPLAMLERDPDTRGEKLFKQACVACHKFGELAPADGKTTAPDLSGFGSKKWASSVLDNPDADWLFGRSAFKGTMPSVVTPPKNPEAAALFTPMKPEDRVAVVEFLVKEAGGDASAKGSAGEKLVKQRCTSCHRLDGKTDDDDSAAPELRGWASALWIEAQIENPGSGKAYAKASMSKDLEGHMPAFAEKLSPADRKLLAAWIVRRAAAN